MHRFRAHHIRKHTSPVIIQIAAKTASKFEPKAPAPQLTPQPAPTKFSPSHSRTHPSRPLPPIPRNRHHIPQRPKRQHIRDPPRARKQHDQPIHAAAPTPGRRHAPLQRLDVALVNRHPGFRFTLLVLQLLLELAALLEGRIFLFVCVDVFAAADEKLDACGDELVGGGIEVGFGERGEWLWVVCYECWDSAEGLDV